MSDHVVSVSLVFHQIPPFHNIAYDYFYADWDGLGNYFKDVP